MTVTIHTMIFWVVMPYNSVGG